MLTSPPPTPQRASVPHKLLAHLSSNVSDFDTGGRVTSSTRLRTLYLLKDQEVNNDRLRNATGKTMPRVPAQMLIKADGQWTAYPPSRDADYGYQVSMRFNTLYSAPTVRIEIEFSHDGQADTPRLPTLVLEYPFNDRDGRQLSNFACELIDGESDDSESDDGKQHNDEQALTIVRFEANGATSEGCVTIDSFASPLTAEQESVFEMFRIQRTTGRTFTIAIAIEAQEASDNTSPTLKLLSKLAGSGGSLLPSLRHREWDDFLPEGWQNMDAKEFLSARPTRPNLMLMQKCGTTFSSVEHFCATHLVAELIANEEGSGELRLWARADHDIALFELKGHVVLAMKFGNPIVLSSGRKVLRHPKIPNDLEIRIKLSDGGRELVWITACHERDLMGLNRHFKFDAYFKVTSHTPADFPGPFHKPNDPRPKIWRAVSLIPHENRFWVESVLHTASTLYYDARWHPFMLGQGLDPVKTVDVIATVEVKDDVKASAWQWLLKAKQWNFQQRRVIDSLHQALDGIVLCTGFPGTGKTPLLLASAVYFVKLGGRAIISAAENGHVESMASNLDLIIGDATRPDGEPIIAYIVQSSSRGKRLLETSGQQAPFNKKGHQDGSAGGLDNFIFSLLLGEEQRDKAFQYTLCNAVAVEAEKGELNLPIRLPDQNGIDYGQPINAWQRLLELMVQIREGIFPHHSKMARSELQKIFSACEKQLIKRADIMVTTACNAKCKELCYWGKYMRESGVSISTFGVFIDNADSCRAMELWNVITSCASRPDIVMIAGDVRVLGPINTSINQIPVCNPFAASLSMSDFERLIKLDLPVTTLTEQGFMNSELVRFLSLEFYNNELSTAPGRDSPLPLGFRQALLQSLSHRKWSKPEPTTLGEKIRLCYLEVRPEALESNERRSIVMLDYVEVFFASVFPALQEHFRERTSKELIVIVAYAYARTKYTECMHGLQEEQGLDNDWYPRIMSVDGSKGHTAAMAFFDGSMEHGDRMGFLKDPKRCNVAMTRATEVFWMIGGPLLRKNYEDDEEAPFYKLRQQLAATGQVIDFPTPKLRTIDRLKAKAKARDGEPAQRRDVALRPKQPAFRR